VLWHLVQCSTLLEESVDWKKLHNDIVSPHEEEEEPNGNNEAQMPHTPWIPKRQISLVNLLLWHKIGALRCFIWRLGLQMWSGSEAVRRNFEFLRFLKKFNIQPSKDVFLF